MDGLFWIVAYLEYREKKRSFKEQKERIRKLKEQNRRLEIYNEVNSNEINNL